MAKKTSSKTTSASSKKTGVLDKIIAFLGSNTFFILILALFLLQAGWLAASAAFPMLYDEYHHSIAIETYSKQVNFLDISQSDENVAILGDTTRSGSYLYYAIMGVFYSLISAISGSSYVQIVGMRLLNVLFVLLGLILYKKIFNTLKINKAISNLSLLVLVLVPIFIYVAAHINYDNLLFFIASLYFFIAVKIIQKKRASLALIATFVSIGVLGSLVKTPMLPVLLVGILYMAYQVYKKNIIIKLNKEDKRKLLKPSLIFASFLLLISGTLFFERYALNVINYGALVPKCEVLHDRDACARQPIIKRNYNAAEAQLNDPQEVLNVVYYVKDIWLPHMVESTVVVGIGAVWNGLDSKIEFEDKEGVRNHATPLNFLQSVYWVLFTISIILISANFKNLRKIKGFGFFLATFLFYVLVLFLYVNYPSYAEKGVAFGIQTRYLILFMPIYIVFTAISANQIIRNKVVKSLCAVMLFYSLSHGAGALTYIVSSEPNWYWQRQTIINTNIHIRDTIKPYIFSSEDVHKRPGQNR